MKQFDRAELDEWIAAVGPVMDAATLDRIMGEGPRTLGALRLALAVLDAAGKLGAQLDPESCLISTLQSKDFETTEDWLEAMDAEIDAVLVAVKACIDAGLGK